MQLSALFLQLPRFLANLTSPAAPAAAPDSAAAAVASSSPPLESSLYSTTTMGAGQKFMKPELPYDYNVSPSSPRPILLCRAGCAVATHPPTGHR